MEKYSTIIGIDISKGHLDLCCQSPQGTQSYKVPNTSEGFKEITKLANPQTLVCMEHTGIYAMPLCTHLAQKDIAYTLIPAIQIKKSLGIQRGKNDKADAQAIARYGHLFQSELVITTLPQKPMLQLKLLYSQRERLVKAKNVLSVPAKEMKGFVDKEMISTLQKSTQSTVATIKKQVKVIDKEMLAIIKAYPELEKAFKLCQSVTGIGPQISIYLLITTKGFKAFSNARQYACYSGMAPFEYRSGSSVRGKSKVSHLANKKAKALISMGAISAIGHDREIKAYYDRKLKEGKHKMSVVNAVRNKLIARVFATLDRVTPYVKVAKY